MKAAHHRAAELMLQRRSDPPPFKPYVSNIAEWKLKYCLHLDSFVFTVVYLFPQLVACMNIDHQPSYFNGHVTFHLSPERLLVQST